MRKTLSLVLTAALALSMTVPGTADAKGAVKLSKTKLTIKVGEKKTIKVKNSKKKIKWTIKSGKKYITLKKKGKVSATIKGKKAGKATVQAKVAGKKLKCKVTVQKKSKEKKNSTPAPTTDSGVKGTPATTSTPSSGTESPSTSTGSPTPSSASESPETPTNPPQDGEPVPVENIRIDLTGLVTTFTSTPAKIDFSSQIPGNFDLSLFSQLKVEYELVFEDVSATNFQSGKIGIAQTTAQLNGFDDGVAFSYNGMTVGNTTGTIDLTGKKGTAVGINIQPMSGEETNYAWPDQLVSVTITGLEFIAKPGAVYPDPDAPVEATPTPGPTYAPEEFVYQGLDTDWINENIDPSKPMVAFTFDDGPVGDKDTDTSMIIQNALADHNAHATFFYIGSQINNEVKRAEILSAKEKGFEIGNHSWGWNALDSLDEDGIKDSIEKTNEVLEGITGFTNFMFRPPNLATSAAMRGYIKAPFAMCGTDSKDWVDNPKTTTEQIVANVKKAKDGDIVLMHETQANTAAAIEEILEYYDAEGIQVVSVSEMFYAKGKKLMTGTEYGRCQ